jgi:AP-1 complex subunit mu
MISALFILDQKGKPVLIRDFRGDIPLAGIPHQFVQYVIEGEENSIKPIFVVDNINYIFMKHSDVYLLAVGHSNLNVSLIEVMLEKLLVVFKQYFNAVDEESVRDNFPMILELLDEMIDFGYPQSYDPSALKNAVLQVFFFFFVAL